MPPKAPSLRQLKAGDKSAWDELVDLHYEPLTHLVCHILGEWCEDVPDLVQEVLVNAYGSISAFREECSLRSWLYRIALNCCRDYRRSAWKRRVSLPGDPPEPADGHPDHAPSVVERAHLDAALALLPEAERLCLQLRFAHELTGREIAQMLGQRESAVWNRIHAGLRHLGRILQDEEAKVI